MAFMAEAMLAVCAVTLVLAAAKAHGRQIRLEREARGILQVDFRRHNDPWVEALWRRDRLVFWPTFAVLAAVAVGAGTGIAGMLWAPHWGRTLAGVPLAFAGAFIAGGAASLVRFVRDRQGDPAWRRSALAGSLAWWMVVAALATACGALLALMG